MLVGLGTGSTAYWAIRELGQRVKEGLEIKAVASSIASEEETKKNGIEIISFDSLSSIDIYIDGADEVDEQKNLVKGGGGALLREKILAYNSKRFIVIVDESKLVKELGRFHLPIEVVPFALPLTAANLRNLKGRPQLRMKDNKPFVTDNGNYILDSDFGPITDPVVLNEALRSVPGIVEVGLFAGTMVNMVIVGTAKGTTRVL
jgi:ribose 5-phosphate isomerase A